MDSVISFLVSHWLLSTAFVVLVLCLLINEWRHYAFGVKGISPQEVVNLINHFNAALLDVRPAEQFAQGHILGAQNIPQKELASQLNKISKFKSKYLVLICGQGVEAPKLTSLLTKEGFSSLYYLAGGMNAWQTNGLPVVNNKKGNT
jgi:rhodanese-related sulfurtransferase